MTRLLGVLGWPVEQSRSPAMQNAALRALGADYAYLPFAVPPERLAAAIEGAWALGARGLNLTIPHKEAALALCKPDPLARDVGAVNTLVFDDDGIHGTNTDVHGFRMLLSEAQERPSPTTEARAVVLGAGGAARAVVVALRTTGFSDITVVSRRGLALIAGGVAVPGARWHALPGVLEAADLLVDATPRGLDPRAEQLDLAALPDHATVLDLVVKRDTALTLAARRRGLRTAAGAPMLLHQGAAALERWLGTPAPVDVMRAALETVLD